jgi:predicted MFS family arabinose efflux permease
VPSTATTAGRQISLLALCQALLYVNNVTLISINGLAGLALAPTPLAATLPITSYVVGSALATLPASLAMARWGRRAGFVFGSGMGIVGTAIAALGMALGSFALLCLGTLFSGVYNAFAQYLRFAAADVADAYEPALKERAIAWVLAGGIAGGLVGPELSKVTAGLLPVTFAASYLALAVVALVAGAIASRLAIPSAPAHATQAVARPLARIGRQPEFVVAVAVGAVSYGAMNLLMTATPLAMKVCGFGYPDAADVIKWHVVGMFAPGFFTGHLIRRFGVLRIVLAGCVLMFLTVGIAHAGVTYWHFWAALFALGVGWNFMFVGATTLLTTTYTTAEKAKVQGVNDLVVFVTMISSSAASGALVSTSGWTDLNLYALPALALAAAGTLYLMARRAPAPLKAA